MNLRDKILAADDLPRIPVECPEPWGCTVYVRRLTAREREEWEGISEQRGKVFPTIVALCCVDEEGKQVFSPEDVEALAEKSGHLVDLVATAAIAHNKISKEDIDDLEKNSDAGR